MSSRPSICSDAVIAEALRLGATAAGTAGIEPVDACTAARYDAWIAAGCHGEMNYLARNIDLRNDPRGLMPSAKTVIVAAFNYYPKHRQPPEHPQFAYYAYGRDYHEVVRERLGALADFIKENYGGETRVCVDTAPLHERYWAQKAGIGFEGVNSQLIIPGRGSYFFIGEVLTSIDFTPSLPCSGDCGHCGACMRACPSGAIKGDGTIDASRCLSYLTIEYRGDLPADTPAGNRIYGCDACQQACPHNRHAQPTDIADFAPSDRFLALDEERLSALTPESFNSLFRHSAIKRTKLSGLLRNLQLLRANKTKH
ncbi:MAG: tRNA epoxyqueuosine(34) reductase QueG [Muribaculum sp.]